MIEVSEKTSQAQMLLVLCSHCRSPPHDWHCMVSAIQDVREGGLRLRGVAFMTVLAVLTVLESTLHSLCFSYKIPGERGNRDGFDCFGGFGGSGGVGHDGCLP